MRREPLSAEGLDPSKRGDQSDHETTDTANDEECRKTPLKDPAQRGRQPPNMSGSPAGSHGPNQILDRNPYDDADDDRALTEPSTTWVCVDASLMSPNDLPVRSSGQFDPRSGRRPGRRGSAIRTRQGFLETGHTSDMRLRLARFELRSAPADSAEVGESNALRQLGQMFLDDVPRLRPAQRWTGQLGRLAGDGWTSEQVQQFIDTWPTASAATLVKLLHSANTLNHRADAIDVTQLAAATHKRFEIDDHGRVRRRT